jgi:transcriptional regulator with XRE-family HTH domain
MNAEAHNCGGVCVRTEKGLSQELLAEKANLHPNHIGLVERCLRNPSLDVAESIAKALDTPLSEMIEEAEAVEKRAMG